MMIEIRKLEHFSCCFDFNMIIYLFMLMIHFKQNFPWAWGSYQGKELPMAKPTPLYIGALVIIPFLGGFPCDCEPQQVQDSMPEEKTL